MSIIAQAVKKQQKGEPLTRKEQKALDQRKTDPNSKERVPSFMKRKLPEEKT